MGSRTLALCNLRRPNFDLSPTPWHAILMELPHTLLQRPPTQLSTKTGSYANKSHWTHPVSILPPTHCFLACWCQRSKTARDCEKPTWEFQSEPLVQVEIFLRGCSERNKSFYSLLIWFFWARARLGLHIETCWKGVESLALGYTSHEIYCVNFHFEHNLHWSLFDPNPTHVLLLWFQNFGYPNAATIFS